MTTTPHLWSHGDTVTIARLNGMIAAMDEVYAVTRDYGYQVATPAAGTTNETYTLFKRARYLHFGSAGTLQDPAGVEDDITLTEDGDTERGTLDLDTIDWLATGSRFTVNGCARVWLDNQP